MDAHKHTMQDPMQDPTENTQQIRDAMNATNPMQRATDNIGLPHVRKGFDNVH